MREYPQTVTRDNEGELFTYIQKKTKKNKRLLAIRRVILPIGCVLFVALSVLMTLGAFSLLADEEDAATFGAFPFIAAFEGLIAPYLAKLPSAWYVQAGARVLAVYAAPIAVSLVLSLLVSLVYRSRAVTKPEGTTAERAKRYHTLASQIPMASESDDDGHALATAIGSYAYTGLILAFLIYGMIKTPSVRGSGIGSMVLGMAVCAVVAWFVYAFLMRIFVGINGMFYAGGDKPYGLLSVTEKYWLGVDKDEATRRRLEEDAARIRKQQEEDDYIHACAELYAKEQQEHDDYLNRLHEWATSDDDFDFTGYGDGI